MPIPPGAPVATPPPPIEEVGGNRSALGVDALAEWDMATLGAVGGGALAVLVVYLVLCGYVVRLKGRERISMRLKEMSSQRVEQLAEEKRRQRGRRSLVGFLRGRCSARFSARYSQHGGGDDFADVTRVSAVDGGTEDGGSACSGPMWRAGGAPTLATTSSRLSKLRQGRGAVAPDDVVLARNRTSKRHRVQPTSSAAKTAGSSAAKTAGSPTLKSTNLDGDFFRAPEESTAPQHEAGPSAHAWAAAAGLPSLSSPPKASPMRRTGAKPDGNAYGQLVSEAI